MKKSFSVGDRFGRWTVVALPEPRSTKCLAQCDCGAIKMVVKHYITSGRSMSCGCLRSELTASRYAGYTLMPEYAVWRTMKARCTNPNVYSFKTYGGRGIAVSDRWMNGADGLTGFECFISDMGRRPSNVHSIERKDNDGPYSPDNCEWVTSDVQARNQRTNHFVVFNGELMILADAIRLAGLEPKMVATRLSRGWDIDRALSVTADDYDKQRCRMYDVDGVSMSLKAIARLKGVKYGTLYRRVIIKGMPLDKALNL